MKASDIREKTTDELVKMLGEKRKELADQQRALHAGELSNVRAITATRRDIALILTIQAETKVAAAAADTTKETK